MRKIILFTLLLLPQLVLAHEGEYHNYTGLPLLFFGIILISSIIFYEKFRERFYGKAVLMSSVLSISFIELFYPSGSEFDLTVYLIISIIIGISFAFNYVNTKL